MKGFAILMFAIFYFQNAGFGQQNSPASTDTLNTALLQRAANHTLSKKDSLILRRQRQGVVIVNSTDTLNFSLLNKLANHTLNRADSVLLKRQLMKVLKIDTILIKFNGQRLSEQNKKADSADLKLSGCDFEKEANAMVLYDIGQMSADPTGIRVERHKRIKIFNEQGKNAANIRIDYTNQFGVEQIEEIEAKTINFNNGKIEYTPLDSKLIYHQDKDKYHESVMFSMPNVKAGSVVEIAYVWHRSASRNLPAWNFQTDIPTRYSQYVAQLYRNVNFTSNDRTTLPLTKDSTIFNGYGHVWAMRNVPSAKIEPFMRSSVDGLQSLELIVTSAFSAQGQFVNLADSWATVGKQLVSDKEFNKTFDQNINDKESLVKRASSLSSNDEKVKFLFKQVKTQMKWNGERTWASKDGIKKAWENKSGNWGEINMVLCRLLNNAGIKAYPMLASTRDNGIMYHNFVDVYQINKLVTYVPIDSTRFYVLDASSKFNNYDEVPFDLLNSYGLALDKEKNSYKMVLLENNSPVKQQVKIDAEIKADGTMTGAAQINSFSYNKANALELHDHLDEKKYTEILTDNNNDLKILSLKLENAEADSLPLTQTINFKLDLPGTDDKYIYFNPNLFTGLYHNPFVSDQRVSDIDFGCKYLFFIDGRYKIPDGYKIDVLPRSQTIANRDKSMVFKRVVSEQDGYITVSYVVSYRHFFFARAAYSEVYDYFKKMNELINEQIVLKKG